jgi:hypothetical protein
LRENPGLAQELEAMIRASSAAAQPVAVYAGAEEDEEPQ